MTLTTEEIKAEADRLFAADTEWFNVDQWFERGVRFAEQRAQCSPACGSRQGQSQDATSGVTPERGSQAALAARPQQSAGQALGPARCDADARRIAAVLALKAVADNFQIAGPDDDGLVWLVLHGNGTSGTAMFCLGAHGKLAVQVALHLEADRRAAIDAASAKREGQ